MGGPYKIDPLNLGIDESLAKGSVNWLSIHDVASTPLGLWYDDFLMKYIAMITIVTAIAMTATPATTTPAIIAVAVNCINCVMRVQ